MLQTFKEGFATENDVQMCSLKSSGSFISPYKASVLPLKFDVGHFAMGCFALLALEKRLCDHCKTLIKMRTILFVSALCIII